MPCLLTWGTLGLVNKTRIAAQLRDQLLKTTEQSVTVEDLDLQEVEDPDGTTSWRVTLFLSAPESRQEGWPVEITQKLKRIARTSLDDVLSNENAFLSGPTAVEVSMKDAPADQVAPDDVPEASESAANASSVDGEA